MELSVVLVDFDDGPAEQALDDRLADLAGALDVLVVLADGLGVVDDLTNRAHCAGSQTHGRRGRGSPGVDRHDGGQPRLIQRGDRVGRGAHRR